MGPRIHVEWNGQFALLAEITQICGEDQSHGFLLAARFLQCRRGLARKLAQNAVNTRPVQVVNADKIAPHQI